MSREKNIGIMNAYFQTLADADYEAFANLFSEDILYNVSGTTEISGQWIGKEALFGYLNPYVFEHINAENSNMSTKLMIKLITKLFQKGFVHVFYISHRLIYPETYSGHVVDTIPAKKHDFKILLVIRFTP